MSVLRSIFRLYGLLFRVCVWLLVWPLGWYLTVQARKRRRHNELVRAVEAEAVRLAAAEPAKTRRSMPVNVHFGAPVHSATGVPGHEETLWAYNDVVARARVRRPNPTRVTRHRP